jgi:hydroxylamine reductase
MYLARYALRHAVRGRAVVATSSALRTVAVAFSTAPMMDAKTVANPDMFCRQCEQTKDHHACVTVGVCGKSSETANLQDALIQQVKSVAHYAVQAVKEGATPEQMTEVHKWTLAAAFSTLTNVNFSAERIAEFIAEGEKHKSDLKNLVKTPLSHDFNTLKGKTLVELEEFGLSVSVPKRASEMGNVDAFSLK